MSLKSIVKKNNAQPFTPAVTEWPTVILIGLTYLAFGLLTSFYQALPLWLLVPLAGYVLALFSSLQHEVLHGHPTPSQTLNEAMIFPGLNLWIPYALYKETHLQHHNNDDLTDPERDPESFYLSASAWHALQPWQQAYYRWLNTFAGRFFWGPFHVVGCLWVSEAKALWKGDRDKLRIWLVHGVSSALVLFWVISVCGIPLWEYLLFFVYPGLAFTLVRSFLEHQAVANPEHRSVIVESGAVLSLMFLNNNLHAVHHAKPGLAWYKIPAVWKAQREAILAGNNQYYFKGYREIIRRYGWRPKEAVCYPL